MNGALQERSLYQQLHSLVEFDLNQYCIDGTMVTLDKTVILNFGGTGFNVDLYLDLSNPGAIEFTGDSERCNVEFTVDANSSSQQFILNYGDILDPVQLTNLKQALALDPFYICPQFKNPPNTRIFNTYLRGGDHVKFVAHGTNPAIRLAVTADVPTIFRMVRRVLDVAVGHNNLSVLVGGLACPNEIHVIGNNCHGELGINSNETVVCFKQVNRCLFDCQVLRIFAGQYVTFYVTQSRRVYASGQWKCFQNSNIPVCIPCIPQSWGIREIAISVNQIVFLGSDGGIFGIGDNSLGELGLCHTNCVRKPVPLVFFYRLNQQLTKQFHGNFHPIERRNGFGGRNGGYGDGYGYDGRDGYDGRGECDTPCPLHG